MLREDLFSTIVAGRARYVCQELAMGASPSSQDDMGRTGLHYAAVFHDEQIASILLAMSPARYLTLTDKHGRTALHYAAASNSLPIAAALLQRGAQVCCCDTQHVTPLHLAAELADRPMVELLLAHGGSLEARDLRGRTPLDYAEQRGNDATVVVLTNDYHHDVNSRTSPITGSRSSVSNILSGSSSSTVASPCPPLASRDFHRSKSDSVRSRRLSPSVQLLDLAAVAAAVTEGRGMAGGVSPVGRRSRFWVSECDSNESGSTGGSSEGGVGSSPRGSSQVGASRPWRRSNSSSRATSSSSCSDDSTRKCASDNGSGSKDSSTTCAQPLQPRSPAVMNHTTADTSSPHAEEQSSPPPPSVSSPACQRLSLPPPPLLPRSDTAPPTCSSSINCQADSVVSDISHSCSTFPHSQSYPTSGNRTARATTGSPPSSSTCSAGGCKGCPYHSAGRLSPSAMHPSALLASVCGTADVHAERDGEREAMLEGGEGGGRECVCGSPVRDGAFLGSCAAHERREEGSGTAEWQYAH